MRDVAAHQRAREHQQPDARQPDDGADRAGELGLADERDGVDGDSFAADVMAVGFGNRAEVRARNPLGRIPALVLDNGEVLLDSSAIIDHLDEVHGRLRHRLACVQHQREARRASSDCQPVGVLHLGGRENVHAQFSPYAPHPEAFTGTREAWLRTNAHRLTCLPN